MTTNYTESGSISKPVEQGCPIPDPAILLESFPQALHAEKQFILYQVEWSEKRNKWNKIPCVIVKKRKKLWETRSGDFTNPKTFTDLHTAVATATSAREQGLMLGVGLSLQGSEKIRVIDLDDPWKADGSLNDDAKRILAITGWTEKSLSGKLHHLVLADAFNAKRKIPGRSIELFINTGFIALTGLGFKHDSFTRTPIVVTAELMALAEHFTAVIKDKEADTFTGTTIFLEDWQLPIVEVALKYLDASDNADWELVTKSFRWNGDPQLKELWTKWSDAEALGYSQEDNEKRWDSFNRTDGPVTTIQSIIGPEGEPARRGWDWQTLDPVSKHFDKKPDETAASSKQQRRVQVTDLEGVEAKDVEWYLHKCLLMNGFNLLTGKRGRGKSTLTTSLAAMATRGIDPFGKKGRKPINVGFIGTEDALKIAVKPRLVVAETQLPSVPNKGKILQFGFIEEWDEEDENWSMKEMFNLTSRNVKEYLQVLIEYNVKLLFIDPVSQFMGSTKIHLSDEVRPCLVKLDWMAKQPIVSVILRLCENTKQN